MELFHDRLKGFMGELVGAAVALPYGIKQFSWDDVSDDLCQKAYYLVGTLTPEAINVLAKNEDPHRYALLAEDPDDELPAEGTPFGVKYGMADEETKQRMLAFEAIKDSVVNYIYKQKGGFDDS